MKVKFTFSLEQTPLLDFYLFLTNVNKLKSDAKDNSFCLFCLSLCCFTVAEGFGGKSHICVTHLQLSSSKGINVNESGSLENTSTSSLEILCIFIFHENEDEKSFQ